MEHLTKDNRIKKVKLKKTTPKVVHTVREISQKEIDEERSSAYTFII